MSRRGSSILDWVPVLIALCVAVAFFWCLVKFLNAHDEGDTNDLIFYGVSMLLLAQYGNDVNRSGR